MAGVRFEDVDLLGALSRIVDLHTQHYKEDFDLDKELISKLAVSERSEDKQLLWMSRPCGTYTLREREVYLEGSHENKVWRFYQEQTNDPVLAYAISLKEVRDGKIFGDLYPLNYREHVERMKKLTCPIGNVAVAFEDGNVITIPYQERRQFMNRLMPEHGAPKTMTYLPENEPELMIILKRERLKRSYHATAGNLEEYLDKLEKENIIIKRGGNEAAEIRYIHITKNSQGMEEIEVQGKFLLSWIGKRILTTQIITKDTTQNILYAIVKQTCTNAGAARNIPNFSISTTDADTGSGQIDYTSEQYANAQLAAETAAKAAKLGIRVLTNARTGKHTFSVYEGRDLTAGNTAGNAPCIFSQEFDNIVEQEYTNSVENLKTTAYVGGEEKEGVTRKVAEVGGSSTGLSRDEVFINATDIVQEYENESGQTVTLTNAQYLALLSARGVEELEQYAETLAFGSKINTNANLKYGTDYDLGDRVTCINKRWNVRIDVRITEIAETYETSGEEIDITFGESLPALLTQIRQITK